jgi:hypothetical protein
MYWYKIHSRWLAICFFVCLGFTACRPDVKETKGQFKYFDLKGFFKADTARLNHANLMVTKTVNHNGHSETKTLKILNWGNELDLFASSDINKPSWRDSYDTITRGDTMTYKAKTPDLKTRELSVVKSSGKVRYIHILNHTKNMLYETTEQLIYLPDSIYTIDKTQHVTLLGSNRYIIKGKFVR